MISMKPNRTGPGGKLLYLILIASLLLIGMAYGDGTVPVAPGNGITGSSGPDGGGGVKVTPAPLGVTGATVTGTGATQQITVDIKEAQAANETVSIQGTAVDMEKGPVTLTITTTSEPSVQDGTITAGVTSITMNYVPVTAQFASIGPVTASFAADLMSLPSPNATIGVAIVEKPDSASQAAFDAAVSKTGYQIDATAYTMLVAKTNLNDGTEVGTATINMSVSPSWINAHGGAGQVKITRYADDGTSQVLDTRAAGIDSLGNMVFTGTSPGGLSIFALVSVKTPLAQGMVSDQPISPLSKPVIGANSILIIPPLLVFVIVMLIRRRR